MFDLPKWINGLKWYDAAKTKEAKHVTASKIGGDLLPIWLSKKYDADESKRIGLNYLGSAFHGGMEHKLLYDLKATAVPELHSFKVLDNGWTVSGTADVLDFEGVVHDYKSTSNGGYKKLRKAAKDSTSQLAVQGAVLCFINDFSKGQFFAHAFIRDWKPWHKDHPASAYQPIEVDIMDSHETEIYLKDKTDLLQGYIDRDVPPPECADVMWMVYEGERFKMKCEYYCDYKSSCPYYSSHRHIAAKHSVQGW